MKRSQRLLACQAVWMLALVLAGCLAQPATVPVANTNKSTTPTPKSQVTTNVTGYATVRGRVTYNGVTPPSVQMLKPNKEQHLCPPEVPGEGWYVHEATRGIRYAVVFCRAPKGEKMPQPPPEAIELPLDPAGKPVGIQEIRVPHAQYEPRVTCLHPSQRLQLINDGAFPCDFSIRGPAYDFGNTMKSGESVTVGPAPSDSMPNRVSCNCHAWMNAYVWRTSHPWSAVTNENGEFELRYVPVTAPGQGKLTLWIWHEMLPGTQMKEVGPLELTASQTLVMDLTLPE